MGDGFIGFGFPTIPTINLKTKHSLHTLHIKPYAFMMANVFKACFYYLYCFFGGFSGF